jgi:signal transduction histidine kinase
MRFLLASHQRPGVARKECPLLKEWRDTMTETDGTADLNRIGERQPIEELAVAGQLALELMHEIKNPLDTLGNLTYLTLEASDNPVLVRKYMGLAEEQIATLNRLARETLGLARSSGTRKLEVLTDLIEAALRVHRVNMERKQIHLIKELPQDLAATVHAGEIIQVVSNLIANALDAMQTDGTLKIELLPRPGAVWIMISDNGRGIPSDTFLDVFKPFYTTKRDTGTGLGLHIARKIIEAHQGALTVQSSVEPGKSGTTFTISLPVSGKAALAS